MNPDEKVETHSAVLDYAHAGEFRAHPALLTLSRIAGIAPLTLGVGELLLFVLTGSPAFALAGFYTLILGGVVVVCGLVFVLIYLRQAKRANLDRTESLRRGRIALLILILNFPVAFACAAIGIALIVGGFRG
jgi:hypothetical protein